MTVRIDFTRNMTNKKAKLPMCPMNMMQGITNVTMMVSVSVYRISSACWEDVRFSTSCAKLQVPLNSIMEQKGKAVENFVDTV